MEIIKKKRIVVRTTRRVVVRRKEDSDEDYVCGQCESEMISTNACVNFIGIGSRIIFRLIESGKIHFIETENKEVYVCVASIKQNMLADFGENDAAIPDVKQLQR